MIVVAVVVVDGGGEGARIFLFCRCVFLFLCLAGTVLYYSQLLVLWCDFIFFCCRRLPPYSDPRWVPSSSAVVCTSPWLSVVVDVYSSGAVVEKRDQHGWWW